MSKELIDKSNFHLNFEQALEAMEFGWILARTTTEESSYISFYALIEGKLVYIDPFSSGYPSVFEVTFCKTDLEAKWRLTSMRVEAFFDQKTF